MKKFILIMLMVVSTSFCACKDKNVNDFEYDSYEDYNYEDSSFEYTVDAYAEAEKEARRECNSYLYNASVSGFQIANSSSKQFENSEIVTMSGSFYAEDKFGEIKGKYVFDITVDVDLESGITYVKKSDILQKY